MSNFTFQPGDWIKATEDNVSDSGKDTVIKGAFCQVIRTGTSLAFVGRVGTWSAGSWSLTNPGEN